MRGFPMNLSPGGMDEPGFPYFATDGKFDFGYGGPPFHPHDAPFFPGHPGAGPMPFNTPGKLNTYTPYHGKIPVNQRLTLSFLSYAGGPMDHAGPIPMVNEFGGITPETNFLNQPNGPPGNAAGGGPPENMIGGPRPGSPEFMTSGNFSEPQNMHNEGLVW